jgi:hypothetical protein
VTRNRLSAGARRLRTIHSAIGFAELGCLGYVWCCAVTRRRDRWLALSVAVLAGEGAALALAGGCPIGVLQRRAGDDVPMFELWFGPRLAPVAIPALSTVAVAGVIAVALRPPTDRERQLAGGSPSASPVRTTSRFICSTRSPTESKRSCARR